MDAYDVLENDCRTIMASICAWLCQLSEGASRGQGNIAPYKVVDPTKAVTTERKLVRLRPHAVLAAIETLRKHTTFAVFCRLTHQKQTFADEGARVRRKARPSLRARDGKTAGVRRHHRCT